VEQIVGTPGSVRRVNVGVVVPRGVAPERLARVRDIVAMAVGFDKERGDGIAVYSLDQMAEAPAQAAVGAAPGAAKLVPVEPAAQKAAVPAAGGGLAWADAGRLLVAVLLAIAFAAWWLTRRKPQPPTIVELTPQPLPDVERARLLAHVKVWLGQPVPATVGEEPRR
jgi:flagellar M-ring protein FliF